MKIIASPIFIGMNTVRVHKNFTILGIGRDRGPIVLWSMVDPSQPNDVIKIKVVTSNDELPDVTRHWEYLGSYLSIETGKAHHAFRIDPKD